MNVQFRHVHDCCGLEPAQRAYESDEGIFFVHTLEHLHGPAECLSIGTDKGRLATNEEVAAVIWWIGFGKKWHEQKRLTLVAYKLRAFWTFDDPSDIGNMQELARRDSASFN